MHKKTVRHHCYKSYLWHFPTKEHLNEGNCRHETYEKHVHYCLQQVRIELIMLLMKQEQRWLELLGHHSSACSILGDLKQALICWLVLVNSNTGKTVMHKHFRTRARNICRIVASGKPPRGVGVIMIIM
ncbi:hypothetical protein P5673_006099 [Acropora cervicornis]|uniref:Uncharacterized protein n=1 Tax=Acropora cervicornis TaxID=6130 RepID=A0AAD9QY08_ACRCE|nr:hypothetical protein P5673_006099 [Acropora cervicornis]